MQDKKLKILVVEDDPVSQYACVELLKNNGFNVDFVTSSTEALDAIHQQEFEILEKGFDLILLDIGLPDIDGHFLAEIIRKTEKQAKSIPIIAITGRQLTEVDRKMFFSMGITDIIIKPFTEEKFNNVFNKLNYN